ncbi:MAG: hypothetical protein SVU32_01555 [Candidatus Nanohaloarchaea archaeon]|nr:hypothetical protein [Candidatus Nanohaloarchaea archaeon]
MMISMYETVTVLGDEEAKNLEEMTYRTLELEEEYAGETVREGLAHAVDAVEGLCYREEGETVQIVSTEGWGRFIPDGYSARLQTALEDERSYDAVGFDELPGAGEVEREAFEAVEERVNAYLDGL